ncbi:MAG: hypothetical protein QOE51_3595 [Actinoplanes sp.]|jgi:hypothetical protein|nr:hypothetical protein [Actinoplanes sp.]
MIMLESLRLLLTAAFGGASLFHLVRCVKPDIAHPHPAGEHRFSELLHLLMGSAMIVMIWPWGGLIPAPVWVALFTLSSGWFLARALWTTGRRAVPVFFATAMGAMVWMGAMTPAQTSSHDHAEMAGTAGMSNAGVPSSWHYTGWISAALGGYLVLAAVWWVVLGLRIGGLASATAEPRPTNWTALCHALMSAGMGVALLTMA